MAIRVPRRRPRPLPRSRPRSRARARRARARRRRKTASEAEKRGPDGLELALKALGTKERTESEIEQLLRDRGVGEEELRDVIEELADTGGIDDTRFAREFAEDKRRLRGWGPDRITEALRARGVDGSVIADAVDSETPDELVDRAVELLAANGHTVEDEASRRRALGLLARRGFDVESAYEAVREAERRSPTL